MNRSKKLSWGFLASSLFGVVLLQMTIGTSPIGVAVALPNHAPSDLTKVQPFHALQ